jgi:hypothetical protein
LLHSLLYMLAQKKTCQEIDAHAKEVLEFFIHTKSLFFISSSFMKSLYCIEVLFKN